MRAMMLQMILALIFLVQGGALEAATPDQSTPVAVQPEFVGTQLKVLNRTVAVFRASNLGLPAAERALRAKEVVERLLAKGGRNEVTYKVFNQGYMIMIDGVMAFMLVPMDEDPLGQETLQDTARNAAAALNLVARETSETRNMAAMLRALLQAAAASLLVVAVIWLLHRARAWLVMRFTRLADTYSGKFMVGGESVFHREWIISPVRRVIQLLFWLLNALLIFNWLGYVLARFPFTRPWGEQLSSYLLHGFAEAGQKVLHTLPELIVALLIFLGARLFTKFIGAIFDRIEEERFSIAGLDSDTVRPTRRLVSIAVWLFALVMAYPYLPGSHTQAFKGLTVLVGLMISLGGSSVVGQAASGLILMYTRTLRPGEYVQIGDSEGTVMEVRMFNTRIRTGLGEELTMPNALVLANITRNHSRNVKGHGYIVNSTVTIGYDTPWRQVHAMLIEAAHRTGGILSDPAPKVFQTALTDFYPQYRLVCQAVPADASTRAELMGALHANIQDVFNEYGVQIMSPHYLGDPAHPKVVPPENWAPPPAGQVRS